VGRPCSLKRRQRESIERGGISAPTMNTSPTMMLLDTMTSPASVVAVSVKGPPAASAPSLTTHWPLPSAVASPLQRVQANVNAWGRCMGRGRFSRIQAQ